LFSISNPIFYLLPFFFRYGTIDPSVEEFFVVYYARECKPIAVSLASEGDIDVYIALNGPFLDDDDYEINSELYGDDKATFSVCPKKVDLIEFL
jgi:hypothetical protein